MTSRTSGASRPARPARGATPRHEYFSTACWHALNDPNPELHKACRNTCKYCDEPCGCPECHPTSGTQPYRTTQVDQARDIARELLAVVRGPFGCTLHPDLERRIQRDPALFWLRGEEREAGTWTPPEERPQ